ncbi:hypothetical protein [Salinisphaera sp. G21_0]|uniref:hypothetical protein n=1 Tax=Salinisphaera sp. G21_0 TaxID=2821094 RepID=UPI001ADD2FD0|nr:hypothetical protein [Salinisphaera sp. G21_0]MBO9484194.1 hypothetical protein [Salinisphaera sp. G21_0]
MSITILDSKETCLDEPSELSVRPETFQKADSGTESEIKIVRVWSMAGEGGSHSVNNSHQYSNVMEQLSPIIHADNLSNKSVSNPPEKITDNKASRLERRRERRRERCKDPAFLERQREYQREYRRERRKDPAFAERERKRKKERYQTDPAFAEHERKYHREYHKERYKTDPAFAEHQRKYHREYHKERYKTDPAFADRERERLRERYKTDLAFAERQREYQREYQRERRKDPVFAEGQRIYRNTYYRIKRQTANKEEASKQANIAKKQYLKSIHSAGNSGELTLTSNSIETNHSSSKIFDGSPPSTFSLQAEGIFTVPNEPVST